jgi:ATP-dependent exoDNAse (exonuclease V) beta subunit
VRARAIETISRPSWAAALVTTEVKKTAWAPADAESTRVEVATTGGGEVIRPTREVDTAARVVGDAATAGAATTRASSARDDRRGAVTVLGSGPDSALEAIVPDTPSHRAERDAAWGVLLHGLLEHAMRAADREVTETELKRLGLWLTLDHPHLRAHLDEAVAIALAVTRAPFWRAAQEATERHVEVPFALRLDVGESGPDGSPVERPTVLHGVIDLVHRAGDGWQVRDYKTGALSAEDMERRYGPQLAAYRTAWTRLAG